MRLAITSNGPGEFSGWVRPLLGALGRAAPDVDVTLFFVPDDYATGREAEVARTLFPQVRVVPPADYVRFALGATVAGVPKNADLVLYLGGDLMHAARVRARLNARGRAYKFSRKRYARAFEKVYAVDDANVRELERFGVPLDRIERIGNLAVDGAFAEAAGTFATAPPDPRVAPGGIVILPGARRHEIASLVPFFLQTCERLRALDPAISLAFGISPFTPDEQLAEALAGGGHPNVWGARGRLVDDGGPALQADGGGAPIPIVRDAMRYANRARAVLTIPGTKCIELAALGVPTMVCVPTNAPEAVVLNGPLQYVDRLPKIGTLLKRAAVVAYDRRFPLAAQPNMDAGVVLMPELRGTLTPGYVATRIAAYAHDGEEHARVAPLLRALYADHAGASERLASDLRVAVPA